MDIEWSEYVIIEDMLNRGWPSNIKEMWVEWHGLDQEVNIEKMNKLTNLIGSKTKLNNWI